MSLLAKLHPQEAIQPTNYEASDINVSFSPMWMEPFMASYDNNNYGPVVYYLILPKDDYLSQPQREAIRAGKMM